MSRALKGQRVLVTRRPAQAGELSRRLRELGAEIVELPAIEILPAEDPEPFETCLAQLERYDWLVLTSANSVKAVRDRWHALALTLPERRPRVASVGATTSQAARSSLSWLELALEPEQDFRAEGLLLAFDRLDLRGERVLLPLSDRARDVLAAGLRARGAEVDAPVAYRTVAPAGLAERFRELVQAGIDLAVFASPSAVENLAAAAPDLVRGLPAAVIGPVTAAAAREHGLNVLVVAEPSTVDGLIQTLSE